MAWAEQTVVLPKTQRMFLKLFLASSDIIIVISVLLILTGTCILVSTVFKSTLYGDTTEQKAKPLVPEEEPLQQKMYEDNIEIITVEEKKIT